LVYRLDPQPYELMATLGVECPQDMDELPWEALVYEQQPHGNSVW
jgi:hypothetical protein